MTTFTVVCQDGSEHRVEARDGRSVMEAIRSNGIDDLAALCGGCCACATCHVYADPAFAAAMPPMQPEEAVLLENLEHRTALSRLSCQILCTPAMAGMRIETAPED